MLRQPARDDPMHVGGAFVQDGVDARLVGHILVEPVEERGDLPVPAVLGTAPDDLAVQDVQADERLQECRTQRCVS